MSTEELFEELYKAAAKGIAWSEGPQYGDLQMNAARASGIVLRKALERAEELGYTLMNVRDVDNAVNGDDQDAWTALGRVLDELKAFAERRRPGSQADPAPIIVFAPILGDQS